MADTKVPSPMDLIPEQTKQELLNEFWWALQQPEEQDDDFVERMKSAAWDGLCGKRYVVSQRAQSGMGPMPDWLREQDGEKMWMRPEAVWGAWCNIHLTGLVGPFDVVQHWFSNHCFTHQPTAENDFETAYQKAEWELRTTGHVTHETVYGLMTRIERLEHRLRGAELGALLKETNDGEVQEAEADAGDDGRS